VDIFSNTGDKVVEEVVGGDTDNGTAVCSDCAGGVVATSLTTGVGSGTAVCGAFAGGYPKFVGDGLV
jgi:hypothetical protein